MSITNVDLSKSQSIVQVALKKHDLPGCLIAVCGADGTGKSTTIGLLSGALVEKGVSDTSILYLRQPSNWWRSDPHVKSTLLQEGDAEIADELALGVFGVADRLNQQVQIIEPALAEGYTVVMDRYIYCLLTYYIAKRESLLDYLVSICCPLFQPDITFILDCPPEIAVDRVVKRDGLRAARYDQQIIPTTELLEAYRSMALSNNLHLLSSHEPPERVADKLLKMLLEYGIGTTN